MTSKEEQPQLPIPSTEESTSANDVDLPEETHEIDTTTIPSPSNEDDSSHSDQTEPQKSSTADTTLIPEFSNGLPSMGILPGDRKYDGSILCPASDSVDINDANVPSVSENCSASASVEGSEVVHKVKQIKWKDIEVPIITQNNNGPCPLLAILNAMVLKGTVTLPRDRSELLGAELVTVVGNAVFDVPRSSVPSEMYQYLEQNKQDAVDILHKLLTGLDVNVQFSGVRDFEFTPELSVFDVLGVPLYHGWVVDPTSEAAAIVTDLSYNQLTNNIIMWQDEARLKNDDSLFLKAMLCEEFISGSVSQLTIHGLFELGSTLEDEEIAVFFRNNHFSTIYKRKGQLYQLLTDQGFLHEDAVWQTLTDVDATFSEFVTGSFRSLEIPTIEEPAPVDMTKEQQINSDHELATMLQHEAQKIQQQEDDFNKVVDDLGLHDLSDEEMARRLQERENQLATDAARATEATSASAPSSSSSPATQPEAQQKVRRKSLSKNSNQCVIL